MKKRYYEIRINAADLPPNKRVLHVVTLNEESPLKRAVAEGLLEGKRVPEASIREISMDECINNWNRSKWQKQ